MDMWNRSRGSVKQFIRHIRYEHTAPAVLIAAVLQPNGQQLAPYNTQLGYYHRVRHLQTRIHTAVCEDFTTQSFYACVVSKDVNRRIKIQTQADRNEHSHVIVWPVECEQTPTFAAMLLFFME